MARIRSKNTIESLLFATISDGDPVDDDTAVIIPAHERIRRDFGQPDIMGMKEAVRPADEVTEPGALIGDKRFQVVNAVKIFDAFTRPEKRIKVRYVSYHSIIPNFFILLYVLSKASITRL